MSERDEPTLRQLQGCLEQCRGLLTTQQRDDFDPGSPDQFQETTEKFKVFWAASKTSASPQVTADAQVMLEVGRYVQVAIRHLTERDYVVPADHEEALQHAVDIARAALCFLSVAAEDFKSWVRTPRSNQKQLKDRPSVRVDLNAKQAVVAGIWQKHQELVDWAKVWKLLPDAVQNKVTFIEPCEREKLRTIKSRQLEKKKRRRRQSQAETKEDT